MAGDFLYLVNSTTSDAELATFLGSTPSPVFRSFGSAVNVNGDDAFQLTKSGSVVDSFGVVGVDGTGEPWEYLDGWAYRKDGTGPDGGSFALANWNFSGTNALDGAGTNAGAGASAFPIGTYSRVAAVPLPVGAVLMVTAFAALPVVGRRRKDKAA